MPDGESAFMLVVLDTTSSRSGRSAALPTALWAKLIVHAHYFQRRCPSEAAHRA